MKIFWTDFAKSELRSIYDYYTEHANQRIARNETTKIVQATLILQKQPEIGQVEQLLAGRTKDFRYLVHQSYKIIYCFSPDKSRVEIMDVFHTRQYPDRIKRSN